MIEVAIEAIIAGALMSLFAALVSFLKKKSSKREANPSDPLSKIQMEANKIIENLAKSIQGFDKELFLSRLQEYTQNTGENLDSDICEDIEKTANILVFNILFKELRDGKYTRSDILRTISVKFDTTMKAFSMQGKRMVSSGYMSQEDFDRYCSNVFWD